MPTVLSSGTYFPLCVKNNDNIDNVGDGEDNQIDDDDTQSECRHIQISHVDVESVPKSKLFLWTNIVIVISVNIKLNERGI